MQQRRLRLGDILDDYCPRERRITNHAVVAMLDEQVKQTRCTTCDAEHEYKEARVPAPRRRRDGGVLGQPVDVSPRAAAADTPLDADLHEDSDDIQDDDSRDDGDITASEPMDDAVAVAEMAADDDDPPAVAEEDGPVHRRLIRATLPRSEGQAPEWKEPEFTIRHPGGRGGREIDGNRPSGHGGQGQRPGRHRRRGGGGGGGQGNGPGNRFGGPRGQGQGQQRHGSGHGQQRQNGNRPGGQPGGNRGDNRGNRGGGGQGGGRRRGGR